MKDALSRVKRLQEELERAKAAARETASEVEDVERSSSHLHPSVRIPLERPVRPRRKARR